ncbi:MAG: fasciclin domain-containing protein [Bacteroidota bacterium]
MKFKFLFIAFTLFSFANLSAQCGGSSKISKTHNDNAQAVAASYMEKDIVAIAAGDENFSTLVAAVKAAGLVETLQGDGPFTVFAPVNDAFAKLPAGTVESLLEPKNKAQLIKILTYHVIAGEFKAEAVVNAIKSSGGTFKVKTVSGDTLMASIEKGNVILTDENGGKSKVVATDVDASNGVIHVIDTVILPK